MVAFSPYDVRHEQTNRIQIGLKQVIIPPILNKLELWNAIFNVLKTTNFYKRIMSQLITPEDQKKLTSYTEFAALLNIPFARNTSYLNAVPLYRQFQEFMKKTKYYDLLKQQANHPERYSEKMQRYSADFSTACTSFRRAE